MGTIKIKKQTAISQINERITAAESLLKSCTSSLNTNEYGHLVNKVETWKKSTGSLLNQIFTDPKIEETFSASGDIFTPSGALQEEIQNLAAEIRNDITQLKDFVNDLSRNLYTIDTPPWKIAFWQAIILAIIGVGGGIITGAMAIPHKVDPIVKQGLENISIEGYWKYICTSFDGTYQHGGRFKVQKADDGSLVLHGERMWKDIKDTIKNKWKDSNFSEGNYLQWHSDWIFVKNNTQINIEYEVPMKTNIAKGFCTGDIISEDGKAQKILGNFYVINEVPILNGQITFQKVSSEEYFNKTPLTKNHL